VATAARDGVVTIWSAAEGERVTALTGQGPPIREIAFSPDGRFRAVGLDDGKLLLFRREMFAPWPEVEEMARKRSSYELTEEDRSRTCLSPWSTRCLEGAVSGHFDVNAGR